MTTTTTTTTAGLPEPRLATFNGAHGDLAHGYYEGHDDEDEHSQVTSTTGIGDSQVGQLNVSERVAPRAAHSSAVVSLRCAEETEARISACRLTWALTLYCILSAVRAWASAFR